MRMTLDLLHEFGNTKICCLFHNCMWQSRHSEVDVYVLALCDQTGWLFTINKSPVLIIGFLVFGWVCWESLPPPATSGPNSFNQLSVKEIFGGGGSDAYTLSCMFPSVSIRTAFGIPVSWECIVKDDRVQSCLTELQSFPLTKFDVDPIHRFDVSSTLFSLYRARRGAFKSITSGSLCSLFIGSTAVKNTVWFLLKICPPGISPGFMMECKQIANPP